MNKITEIESTLATFEIDYAVTFVPQRRSRNAGNKHYSLNWQVTLRRNNVTLTTDYMQGIGHVNYPQNKAHLVIVDTELKCCAETGEYPIDWRKVIGGDFVARTRIPAPALRDVIYSLLFDSVCLDQTFDDFCDTFEYSNDSISARNSYDSCCDIGRKLRKMFSEREFDTLGEIFQDY